MSDVKESLWAWGEIPHRDGYKTRVTNWTYTGDPIVGYWNSERIPLGWRFQAWEKRTIWPGTPMWVSELLEPTWCSATRDLLVPPPPNREVEWGRTSVTFKVHGEVIRNSTYRAVMTSSSCKEVCNKTVTDETAVLSLNKGPVIWTRQVPPQIQYNLESGAWPRVTRRQSSDCGDGSVSIVYRADPIPFCYSTARITSYQGYNKAGSPSLVPLLSIYQIQACYPDGDSLPVHLDTVFPQGTVLQNATHYLGGPFVQVNDLQCIDECDGDVNESVPPPPVYTGFIPDSGMSPYQWPSGLGGTLKMQIQQPQTTTNTVEVTGAGNTTEATQMTTIPANTTA